MSLIHIRAHFECDECGKQFSVGIAADYVPPAKWSMFDVAEDSVRGSLDYEEKGWDGGLCSSVQNEKHLCKDCTKKADEESPEEVDEPPSVESKLGFAAAVRDHGDDWLHRGFRFNEKTGSYKGLSPHTVCALGEVHTQDFSEAQHMRMCTRHGRLFQVETAIFKASPVKGGSGT